MMSIHEDDYTEEHDGESKVYRVVRGCFKGVLYGASALVWILVFYAIFSTRESKLLKKMYFTEATRSIAEATEDFPVYQINPLDFMNDDGSITLSNIWYAKETGELEFGIKYNKKLTNSITDDPIRYVLTDQNGTEYPVVGMKEDAIGRYGYARVCFSGLSLPLDNENAEELVLTLTLYRRTDDQPLSTYIKDRELVNNAEFTVYNAETVFRTVEYDG